MTSESSSSSRRGRQFLTSQGQLRFGTCGLLLGALTLAACSDEARHISATEPDDTFGAGPDGTATELISGVKLGLYGDNWLRTTGDDGRQGGGKQVLRQQGDRLYALSGNEGLAVIDLSDPSAPRVAGRQWSLSTPFELLAEDGVVLALHDSWPSYVCEEGTASCRWRFASRLQALDTRDATQIALLSDLSLPGALAAVHRAGNVLYVVSTEQECWGCVAERNYAVTSFDVHDPANLQVLDQLRFFTRWNAPAPLPVFVPGAQRLYLASTDSDPRDPSSVQVVDISDPGGALVEGARFDVQAALTHPSQLQEEGGILRIVNWPAGAINSDVQPPVAQAFRVSSSSDVQAAGSLRVQVEEPRFQGSVRWQGTRAYLSMFRQVIALDLDNPDQPQQVVTLDLPGSVYGVEPLGDRLLVVSDEGASLFADSLQLRSFDVSTLAQPTLLDTETLDGSVRSEGSPYTFFPEQGLIALPLNGGNFECHYPAGISLFDLDSSGLLQRGVIADAGNASLLFLHRERLLGVGERHIETFDIDDRDAPLASGRLDLIHPASAVQPLGEDLLVVGHDFASGRTLLQVLPPPASQGIASQGTDAVPLGKLLLGLLNDARSCTGSESELGSELFVKGEHVYVPFAAPMRNAANSLAITLRHVDVSDRAAPRLVGELQLGEDALGSGINYRLLQQTDNALLVGLSHSRYVQGAQLEVAFFDILDLSNPAQPQLASRFDLPAALQPGWGEIPGGVTLEQRGRWRDSESRALLTDGNLLITQHRVPVAERSNAAAYYLDRLDLSDPYHPRLLPTINIPGAVVYFNQQTGDLLTFDAEPTTESSSIGARTLHWLSVSGERAEKKGQVALDGERRLHAFAVSQNNIFFTTVGAANDVLLEALRLESGQLLHLPAVALPRSHVASATLFAQGSRAFDVAHDRLTVIDLLDPDAPRLTTPALPHWPCGSLQLSGNTLYCADRVRGVDRIDLSPAP